MPTLSISPTKVVQIEVDFTNPLMEDKAYKILAGTHMLMEEYYIFIAVVTQAME